MAAMVPMGSRRRKGKVTDRAKIPTSVVIRRLSLDRDRIKAFISEYIQALIRIYNVCGVKDEKAWDLFYDVLFLNPVRTRHFSQFPLMWPSQRSRSSALEEWWAAFGLFTGRMCDKTRNQMNIGR